MNSSRRIFSWPKRQSASDMYYRTGGIIAIDTSPHVARNGVEAKVRLHDPESRGALAERMDVFAQTRPT
jgi:hypothetical protein